MSADQPERAVQTPATVEVRPDDAPSSWVVIVTGEIDVATSPVLRQALADLIDRHVQITVDLSGTTFIDSSGLGVLVGALKKARERGNDDLVLRGLQEPVRRVFEITGLTELFPVEH